MSEQDKGAARDVRERYRELAAKVDTFFTRVQSRHGSAMQCKAGCTACCHVRLSVTALEASVIREGLAGLPEEERVRLAHRAKQGAPGACPALEADGRCAIYTWRPLVCRSHGVPIRHREPDGETSVSACEKNFEAGAGLPDVSPDCVLDQTTLSTVLGALDAAYADARGARRGERIRLDTLLGDSLL
ncbi:YkgJ family cysteine cluster protein [Vitiosangium sp. GDMCC 1.1324]|uniref:YkgJ family cysteine cluster protein n=1 Tax=Vitiosangium sp. (strain GDMCC 1.1324) TaxID=2138576 RepID=UPI000D3B2BAD|nr:YkgJ family cysteine cluster protein [Vitiosangium sp. GDMCC 1.1324]PTL80707.1 YkgJ family cysteine cluster protein [Vitiosangium sp. GDMCC 1.1324]